MSNHHLLDGETFTYSHNAKRISNDTPKKGIQDRELDDKYRKGEMRIVMEQGRIDLHAIVNTLDTTMTTLDTEGK